MEELRQYIITIVTALILMTAIEIISPDKPIKKYIKFVLGVIFISVMINPIIHFLSNGEARIITMIKDYEKNLNNGLQTETEKSANKAREESFKDNLNKNCEKKLNDNFKGMEFDTNIECYLDFSNMTYVIEKVQVGVKDKNVKLIDKVKIKVNIGETKEVVSTKEPIENEEEIINYLVEILGVSREKIQLYSA